MLDNIAAKQSNLRKNSNILYYENIDTSYIYIYIYIYI